MSDLKTLMRPSHLTVVIAGKDARTDAIGRSLAACPGVSVFAVSEHRSPGMIAYCERLLVHSVMDTERIVRFVRDVGADVVVVGPEEPLGAGLVDAIESATTARCFGPTRSQARIETSKSWTRELLDRHGIPGNPEHRVFRSTTGLMETLQLLADYVVKPDGLTGGKGVRVRGEHLDSDAEAMEYAEGVLRGGDPVLIEERLDGEEFSLQTITDGQSLIHCPLVQDHKRAYRDDEGPNTGGMGSYSDADHALPFLGSADVIAAQRINERVIEALARESGDRYRGVLYGGFMATARGVHLIEYNARFGDPEALNVLPLLEGDFAEVCWSVSRGVLDPSAVRFADRATVCKYIVPEAYPASKGEGDPLEIPTWVESDPNIRTYWAAVNVSDDQVLLTASRAVAFVGIGDSINDAEMHAERAASSVEGPVRYREDIGTEALVQRRRDHMTALRGGS